MHLTSSTKNQQYTMCLMKCMRLITRFYGTMTIIWNIKWTFIKMLPWSYLQNMFISYNTTGIHWITCNNKHNSLGFHLMISYNVVVVTKHILWSSQLPLSCYTTILTVWWSDARWQSHMRLQISIITCAPSPTEIN